MLLHVNQLQPWASLRPGTRCQAVHVPGVPCNSYVSPTCTSVVANILLTLLVILESKRRVCFRRICIRAMANPSQLLLLADHVKLSLLERQRAISLNLEPNAQDGNISRSLESMREGIEAVEEEASRLQSKGDSYASPASAYYPLLIMSTALPQICKTKPPDYENSTPT